MSIHSFFRRVPGLQYRLIGALVVLLALALSIAVPSLAPARAATDNNPVLPGYNADPQIAVFNHTFYIYPSTDGIANWAATSFKVWSSTDMIHWTDHGVILNLANVSWCHQHAWSPSIAKKGSTYYFYFTACSEIGVATSSSPTGPFTDALGKPLVSTKQYGVTSIDPAVFIDSNGQPYLIFGNGGCRLGKLNANMTSFSGTPASITPRGAAYREAPYMFKRNGVYYLTWSQNDTRQATYQVSYAKSTSITGPFVAASGNPILSENTGLGILGTGSASIWGSSTGQYYIAYHRFAIPGGDGYHRVVAIDPLNFNADGTIKHVAVSLTGPQTAVSPSPDNPLA
jgi:beta-xylosidase